MSEVAGPSQALGMESPRPESPGECSDEPEMKKPKLVDNSRDMHPKLEDRLGGILCCAVCLDLPRCGVFQCQNGHLMCAACFSHLLADARLKDETSTCPSCRCEISKSCTRNLAVEKALCELPSDCLYCGQQLPRNALERHQKELCPDRTTKCMFSRIGCPWSGPFHESQQHEDSCSHPNRSALEIMDGLASFDERHKTEMSLFNNIFNLLSYEKITFSDLQLKPYRTDDFITKLFYETSRFSAFNYQWVIKARINDNLKNPAHTHTRSLTYQLALKSRAPNPIEVHYVVLKGPYGEMKVEPKIYRQEFTNDTTETEYLRLPLVSSSECNRILAGRTINFRLIMFQVQK